MKSNSKWVQEAVSAAHGQFKAKARAAGMSTAEYANKMKHTSGKTGNQARLAQTLMGFHKGK